MTLFGIVCFVGGVALILVGVFSVNDGAMVPPGIVAAGCGGWILWGETVDADPRADRDREA